jgi:hypothetical protein
MECHGETDLATVDEDGNEVSLYVDLDRFMNSIHGGFSCTDCHADALDIPHADDLETVDCSLCHEDVMGEYGKSIHAEAARAGSRDAPTCSDCHGKHDILPSSDPASRTHPLNLANTCATCHSNPSITKRYRFPITNPLAAYRKSVHGTAVLTEENFEAATCSSCHGAHDIRPLGDPSSTIYWRNVPETCGHCHGDIESQYTESVHWTAARQGIREAPVCIDCHGEHEVRSPEDPNSPVHPLRVSRETCGRCHASEVISQRYSIAERRVDTFQDSYHGLAIRGGSLEAANCASCHGIHNILPSSDPRSMVYPANLATTCGKCHPNATANVARGPVHLTGDTTPGRVVSFVKNLYVLLIVVVIGGMLLHNAADLVRRGRRALRRREQEE